MGAVAVAVPFGAGGGDRFALRHAGGEVAAGEAHALEGRMARIDAGVEHGDAHTRAVEGRCVRADCGDAPIRGAGGVGLGFALQGDGGEQDGRHHLADAAHLGRAGGVLGLMRGQRHGLDRRLGQGVRLEALGGAGGAEILRRDAARAVSGRALVQIAQNDVFFHGNAP